MMKDETGYGTSGIVINCSPVITVNNTTGGNTASADRTDSHRRTEGIDSSGLASLVSGIGGLMRIVGGM